MPDETLPEPIDTNTEQTSDDDNKRPTTMMLAALLAIATAVGAVVVVGGMWITGYWSGGRETPESSVNGFLQAVLIDHDSKEAASYLCKTMTGSLNETMDLLDTGTTNDDLGISWDNLTEIERNNDIAVVTADVTIASIGTTSTWSFAVVTGDPDDSWRVCGVVTETE